MSISNNKCLNYTCFIRARYVCFLWRFNVCKIENKMNVQQLLDKCKLLKLILLKMQSFTILQNNNCYLQETGSTCGELVISCNDHLKLFLCCFKSTQDFKTRYRLQIKLRFTCAIQIFPGL